MNWLDIAILTITTLFILLGLIRGFVNSVFSIFAIVGGIIAGVMFNQLAGELLAKYDLVNNKPIGSVAGFVIIMVGTYSIIQLIAWLLTKLMGALNLSWLNRMGGGLLGLITGVIVVFFLSTGLSFFFTEKEPPFKDSVLAPYVKQSFSALNKIVPDEFKDKLERAKELIHKKGIKAAVKEAEKIGEVFKEEKNQ